MWEYNVSVGCITKLPVYSVVVYLIEDGQPVEPPYIQKLARGNTLHVFFFQNIKLWEIEAEVLMQQVPLVQGPEVLQEMIDKLIDARNVDEAATVLNEGLQAKE